MKTIIIPPPCNKLASIVSLMLLSVCMVTCTIDENLQPKPDVVLPKEVKNSWSVENVSLALRNVAARSGGRIQIVPPDMTHNYVRFEPMNLDQTMLIYDLGYELWSEPLDQHLEYEGESYHHPGLSDSLNYYYTLIPANYSIVQTVPHTILGQIVLFDEDVGDEQDPEDDLWIPDPDNCPDPTNPNCPCYEVPCARHNGNLTPDVREDLVKKTTNYLRQAGVNLVELYNEMMILAGYDDEVIPVDAAGRYAIGANLLLQG